MRDKLEKIIKAYEELEKKLSDPVVASDIKEFTRLNKEYAHQSDLIAASREYIARSMTSRLPRKCSTILPMPMRRRCSRWTSPKTRPSFPSSRKTLSTCSSRATPTTTRTPSSRFAPPPVATRRHLRWRPVQDVSALLRVARLEDHRARLQPQRGRRL